MRIAVTGGTGTFGSYLVPELVESGHEPVIISRRRAERSDGIQVRVASVGSGEGLGRAVEDVDAVVHSATNPARARLTEVDGSRNVAAAAGDRHVVYLSIVGVDLHRFPYYRAKLAGEQVIATAPNHSILRATQFHDLLDWWLSLRAFPTTPDLAFQLIDARTVARRLTEIIDAGPSGRVPDIGGPQALGIRHLAETRRAKVRTARLVPVPRWGFLADFDAGRHIDLDAAVDEGRSWEQFLEDRHGS